MPDTVGSKMNPSQDTTEPTSQACGASVITYLTKGKNAAKTEEK